MRTPRFKVPAAEFDKFECSISPERRFCAGDIKERNLIFMYGCAVVRGERRGKIPVHFGERRIFEMWKIWHQIQGGVKIEDSMSIRMLGSA